MADPHGAKLYVNLGPSQVRRRLKGFGHGVRKVQSAGRNRSAIIHTATGRHLAELQGKFADVGYSLVEGDLGAPLEQLRNLGPASSAWLRAAGIGSLAELRRLGAVVAFARVRDRQPQASLNLLWALAAGLAERDFRELTSGEKAALRAELYALQAE